MRYLDDGDAYVAPAPEEDPDDLENEAPPEVQEDQGNQQMLQQAGNVYIPGVVGASPDMLAAPPPPPADIPLSQGGFNPMTTSVPAPPPTRLQKIAQWMNLARPEQPMQVDTGQTLSYPEQAKVVSNLYNQFPQRQAPNWLERTAAGALGAAAGWSNAARRAAPIDIQKATEPILYPGYAQKVAQWESQLAPAEKQLEIAQQQAAATLRARQVAAETGLKGAQYQYYLQRGQYYGNLNPSRLVTVTPEMETATGGKVHRGTTIPASVASKIYDDIIKGNKPTLVRPGEVLLGPDNKPLFTNPANPRNTTEWDAYMTAAGGDAQKALALKQKDDIDRARQSKDPLTARLAQDRLDDQRQKRNDDLDHQKITDETRVRNNLFNQLANANNPNNKDSKVNVDAMKANAMQQARTELQDIQDRYARTVRQRGGTADDYDVGIDNAGHFTYSPRATRLASGAGGITPPSPPVTQPIPARQPSPIQQGLGPVRRYNAAGQAVEWTGTRWVPVP